MLSRRHIIAGGLAAVAAPSIVRAAPITNRVTQRLVVLGDSYSDPLYDTAQTSKVFPSWPELLVNRGRAVSMRNLAVSGATAMDYSSPLNGTFKKQLDTFLAAPNYGPDDITVVYFGYNDIARYADARWANLNQAKADFRVGVDRLLTAGAATGNRRLLITAVHDWSRNPKKRTEFLPRTRHWLTFTYDFIAQRRATHRGMLCANVYRRFTDIFARPLVYGLQNVTTADPNNAGTTALFYNDNHFGAKGQQLLADEFSRTLDLVCRTR
ncbi:SGNH/GDSL hydrolase family protein [Geminicoccus roseus]|uniref:SGNH/GDSL hydrolase family protein n=1 Tax=Geminicoccus roseus TaxID=404900 RepID=UPI0004217805|nr:SGNH/GDSL hydrolase family protein [Geminicoccus roseus]